MGIKTLLAKLGLKKLTLKIPFVSMEFDLSQKTNIAVLQLTLIEAAVAYSIYSASLINYAILLKGGEINSNYRNEVEKCAENLQIEFKKCGININIPTDFRTADELMSFLTNPPVLLESFELISKKYSQYQADFFGFCTIIGAVVVAKGSSAPIKQAQSTGYAIGLPEDVIEGCIKQPGFGALRHHIKNNQG